MKIQKPVVSIFSTIWGHKSIGEAVNDALKDKFETHLNLITPEKIFVKPYNTAYHFFPSLTKIPFKVSQLKYLRKIAENFFSKSYTKKIEMLIKQQKPDVVVSTYFAFNFSLTRLIKKYKFLPINIIADPRTFHKLSLSPKMYNFAFDDVAIRYALKTEAKRDTLVKCGWFVRKNFHKCSDKNVIRRQLNLAPNKFTVTVVGGSEGTFTILKILPAFINSTKSIQVIFICGNNKALYTSLRALTKMLSLNKKNKPNFYAKGFIKNTHKYLQASDIVIGKAGPNLLFETVATQTPFFAISHIAGQEDGNLEIIKDYNLGFVEERSSRAVSLTKKIIASPNILDRFQTPLEKLAEYNRSSYSILSKFIEEKLLKENKSS
ncbi:MAG: MurG2 [Candidatus Curtissbacteria bacterium GW2011_GWA1_40_16]|uniref:MurG2 n=1 Tax=Candidatus Curtissbacteria bacterium GW2011_GWA1_40_16 TaxID=1618405 RepID=A0A0G0TS23_9BACT|nr:MAG: MurG2 [Candidatus Curtissbacteria bacterium GW2011_GWA1_40_16]